MTTAKRLTAQDLLSFIGGQFKTKSAKQATYRGEIANIEVDSNGMVSVTLSWSAIKFGDVWYENLLHVQQFRLAQCEFRWDGCQGVRILRLVHVRSGVAMTFYPKDHKTNVKEQDVKSRPRAK